MKKAISVIFIMSFMAPGIDAQGIELLNKVITFRDGMADEFYIESFSTPSLLFDGGTPRFGYYGATNAWEPNATTLNMDLGST